jgi:hypothetical protein
MSIKIKFSQTELRDRAATILSINRSYILNVAPTCGGKSYLVLVSDWPKQRCETFSIWQLVDALPLQSHNVSADLLLTPIELLQSLSFMGLSMLPNIKSLKHTYRQLSKKYHPDLGGNADDFRQLNDCYQRIESWICR